MPDAGGGFGVVGTVGVVVRGGGGGAGFGGGFRRGGCGGRLARGGGRPFGGGGLLLLLRDSSGLLPGGFGGGADAGLPRLLVPPGLLLGGETFLPRRLERDGRLLETGELLGQRVLLGGERGGALAGGERALGSLRGCCRRLFGGLGPALLGLAGGAVEGGGVEACRLGVGERLGALATDGLDTGRPVDHVLRTGAEEGVELGCAHALLVCVGGQE